MSLFIHVCENAVYQTFSLKCAFTRFTASLSQGTNLFKELISAFEKAYIEYKGKIKALMQLGCREHFDQHFQWPSATYQRLGVFQSQHRLISRKRRYESRTFSNLGRWIP